MQLRLLAAAAVTLLAAGAPPGMAVAATPVAGPDFVDRYCAKCHNAVDWAGGLALDTLPWDAVPADGPSWEKVVRKLRTRMMPPADEPQPSATELGRFTTAVERRLDAPAAHGAWIGPPRLRRLTRSEYANAIRDLLALDAQVESLLPPDTATGGFDTQAETLGSSPRLVEGYVAAAARLSRRAVGETTVDVTQKDYRAPPGWSQQRHIDGLPLGTRGGLAVTHEFPADGEYEFTVATASGGLFSRDLPRGTVLFAAVDGMPVEAKDLKRFRLPVRAGARSVQVAMVEHERLTGTDDIYTVEKRSGAIASVTITGPYDARGAGDTASRRAVFVCRPSSTADEEPCARRILARLASRAYRRPVGERDALVEPLLATFRTGRADAPFDEAIGHALARILVNPRFLLRLEAEPAGIRAGQPYRVPDLELATRLSFFLWSSLPDDALREAAAAGRLSRPAELERQVRRMLADPRATALAGNFAAQWLNLRAFSALPADERDFDENLKRSLRAETDQLVATVIREDRSVLDLVDADYTFVDERLARHYGMAGIRGSHLRRVSLADHPERRGLLGQGSVLTLTSVVDRTSPVIRGKWILENLLGAAVPAPPPGVETDLEAMPEAHAAPATLRQRLEQHRAQPACASCHQVIDPLGFALENFDRIGRWRTTDGGAPVDARGQMADGTPLTGPDTLRRWIASNPDVFVTHFVEKLLAYSLGRSLDHRDMPLVRDIVRRTQKRGYRLSDIVLQVVRSRPFQWRVAEGPAPLTAATTRPQAQEDPR